MTKVAKKAPLKKAPGKTGIDSDHIGRNQVGNVIVI